MVRRLSLVVMVTLVAGFAASCGDDGGSSSSDGDTVNGCKIEPNTDCSGADLSAQDLEDADLEGANLSGADLSRADLRNADLENANLERANLDGADLSNADLTGANLMRIQGDGTNFSGANLTNATFRGATLNNINVANATNCNTVRNDGSINNENCQSSGNSSDTPQTSTPTTGGQTTTTTTAPSNAPVITAFNVPATYTCAPGEQATSVAASWTTQNVTSISFLIDGSAPGADAGNDPNGSGNIGPIPCNGATHTVTLDAFGANNQSTSKSATINPG